MLTVEPPCLLLCEARCKDPLASAPAVLIDMRYLVLNPLPIFSPSVMVYPVDLVKLASDVCQLQIP